MPCSNTAPCCSVSGRRWTSHGLMMANPLGRIRGLRARGGRFVVVDPRTSESARHADLHVALRPGSGNCACAAAGSNATSAIQSASPKARIVDPSRFMDAYIALF